MGYRGCQKRRSRGWDRTTDLYLWTGCDIGGSPTDPFVGLLVIESCRWSCGSFGGRFWCGAWWRERQFLLNGRLFDIRNRTEDDIHTFLAGDLGVVDGRTSDVASGALLLFFGSDLSFVSSCILTFLRGLTSSGSGLTATASSTTGLFEL